jgi:decaprenyl-phosphate phosphoribosyltransferase
MRPGQWIKNVLVVAAPAAAGVLLHDGVPVRVALAFVGFCLLSGATYIVNDARDAKEDLNHPRKRHRPIAAGQLEVRTALVAAGLLMLAGLGLCLIARPLLAVVGAGYLAVSISYTFVWRRIVLADVAAIAAGFVLRAVAGGVAAPVALSRSFLLVITFGSIYVAAGKRHAELAQPPGPGDARRRVLLAYTARRLRLVMVGSALAAFVAYCVWALGPNPSPGFGWRELTVLPFAACLIRYGIQLRRGAGEAPEVVLAEDRLLQLLALCWTVVFALSVHAAS